jgi:hypothetical protein
VSTEKWLVVVGEETLELSFDDLRALILDGRVKPTDRVKKEGLNSHNLLTGVGVIWLPVISLLIFLPLSIGLGLLVFYLNIVIACLIGRTLFKSADEGLF